MSAMASPRRIRLRSSARTPGSIPTAMKNPRKISRRAPRASVDEAGEYSDAQDDSGDRGVVAQRHPGPEAAT